MHFMQLVENSEGGFGKERVCGQMLNPGSKQMEGLAFVH